MTSRLMYLLPSQTNAQLVGDALDGWRLKYERDGGTITVECSESEEHLVSEVMSDYSGVQLTALEEDQ